MEGGVYFRFFGLLLGEVDRLGEVPLDEEGAAGGLGLPDLLGESLLLPPKFKRIEVPPVVDPEGAPGRGGDFPPALDLGDLGRGGEGGIFACLLACCGGFSTRLALSAVETHKGSRRPDLLTST